MNTIVEACDKIADTATAHDRVFIVEVMGRDCGYLAMTSAIAVGADLALFPEAGKPESEIVDQIVETVLAVRQRQQKRARRVSVRMLLRGCRPIRIALRPATPPEGFCERYHDGRNFGADQT